MATSSVEQKTSEGVGPLLVIAALAREIAPLGREYLAGIALIKTGEGPRNAERMLRSWLDQSSARAVLGIGFAGALSSSLRAGDLVVAREVRGIDREGESYVSSPALLAVARRARIERLHFGTAVTVDEIVGKASAKRQLATVLAKDEIGCVDMESSAVARVCGERGLPFLIVRSITDLLDEDLPIDFNSCRTRDGRVSAHRVIRAALARPQSFKELLELRRRSHCCAERLAAFIRLLLPLIK